MIEDAETEYQYARVIQTPGGERRLELNEGQAIHSLNRPGSYLTGGYWDDMTVLPARRAGAGAGRIAILGNAAGTWRGRRPLLPDTLSTGWRSTARCPRWGASGSTCGAAPADLHRGRTPVPARDRRAYDAILVDAYRQPYIPFYLSTREFFALARDRLNPGGLVIINVGHPERSDALEKVLTATMRDAFPSVVRVPAESTNTILVAGDRASRRRRWRPAARRLPADLQLRARTDADIATPGLRGGRSTPTTRRRWSGWSTPRSCRWRPTGGER